jgi:type IV pilus assembly protein PilX
MIVLSTATATATATAMTSRSARMPKRPCQGPSPQRGVVLIVALILLMILSMTAAYSIRGAGSSELVANNTRTQHLAMQSAEAALRYCETGVVNSNMLLSTPTLVLSPLLTPTAAPSGPSVTYTWQGLSSWDGTGSAGAVSVIAASSLALNDSSSGLYKRSPECMAQYMQTANTHRVIVTARGFGPDVAAADSNRTAPKGSEVWLQSTLVLP